MSNFLDPTNVSPIEVRRYQITEDQFGEIQAKLEVHVLELLQDFEDLMAECVSSCDLPYLEQSGDDDSFECKCYDPEPEPRSHYPFGLIVNICSVPSGNYLNSTVGGGANSLNDRSQ